MNKWNEISYVLASQYRKNVLNELDKGKTPSMLAKSLNVNLSHVSRALKELSVKGLVKCLTPKVRKGKIFKRTKQGDALIKRMEKI